MNATIFERIEGFMDIEEPAQNSRSLFHQSLEYI